MIVGRRRDLATVAARLYIRRDIIDEDTVTGWRKWTMRTIASIVGIVLVAAATVYGVSAHALTKSYANAPLPTPIPATPAMVEHGKHLAAIAQCMECHGENLAGTAVVDDPMFGHVYSANLTTGKGGVGSLYSDAQLMRAIRQGVKHDGSPIAFMAVPDFSHFSDEDVSSIIAYLRTVPPVDKVNPPTRLGPIGRMLLVLDKVPVLVPARHFADLASPIAPVTVAPTAAYGAYMANTLGCRGCHGEKLVGGPVPGGPPTWPPAPSINAKGLMGWTEADFTRTLRTGVIPGGRQLNAAMPYRLTKFMTDDEIHALWLYLSTYAPSANAKG